MAAGLVRSCSTVEGMGVEHSCARKTSCTAELLVPRKSRKCRLEAKRSCKIDSLVGAHTDEVVENEEWKERLTNTVATGGVSARG